MKRTKRRVYGEDPVLASVSKIRHRTRAGEYVEYKMQAPEAEKVLVIPLYEVGRLEEALGLEAKKAYLVLADPRPEPDVERLREYKYAVSLYTLKRMKLYAVEPPKIIIEDASSGLVEKILENYRAVVRVKKRGERYVLEVELAEKEWSKSRSLARKRLEELNRYILLHAERLAKLLGVKVEIEKGRIAEEERDVEVFSIST